MVKGQSSNDNSWRHGTVRPHKFTNSKDAHRLARRSEDDVTPAGNKYLSTIQVEKRLAAGNDLEVLCVDLKHYFVKLLTESNGHTLVKFPGWGPKHNIKVEDWRDLFLAPRGCFSTEDGIGKQSNKYEGSCTLSTSKLLAAKKSATPLSSSRRLSREQNEIYTQDSLYPPTKKAKRLSLEEVKQRGSSRVHVLLAGSTEQALGSHLSSPLLPDSPPPLPLAPSSPLTFPSSVGVTPEGDKKLEESLQTVVRSSVSALLPYLEEEQSRDQNKPPLQLMNCPTLEQAGAEEALVAARLSLVELQAAKEQYEACVTGVKSYFPPGNVEEALRSLCSRIEEQRREVMRLEARRRYGDRDMLVSGAVKNAMGVIEPVLKRLIEREIAEVYPS